MIDIPLCALDRFFILSEQTAGRRRIIYNDCAAAVSFSAALGYDYG
jgi:hypothetical protein